MSGIEKQTTDIAKTELVKEEKRMILPSESWDIDLNR